MSKLSSTERDKLPSSDFVFQNSREYPIHDKEHAEIAIKDASGTAQEGAVRRAVARRYPDIQQSKGPAVRSGMRG